MRAALRPAWLIALGTVLLLGPPVPPVHPDEDTGTAIETGEFRNGHRPYVEAGIDGSTQVIGITDTGLSLDAAVLSDGTAGVPGSGVAGPAGLGHRKVVAYVRAQDLPGNSGGNGDLLTCDGTAGGTHGHLVASIAAGNASEILADLRTLPGFEPDRAGTATPHAVDGVAPGARIYFVDDQVNALCTHPEQTEARMPGLLSANATAARTFGINNGLDLKIHNFSFSAAGSESSYTVEAQAIDAFLHDNQDFLVVVAAGNKGLDARFDGNLDFGSILSPGTAKNVLTVGSSGYPNDALDPVDSVVPGTPNLGVEILSRFGVLATSQGPAAFTLNAGGGTNWRIKPDVMAPGDETLGNQRLPSPTTCQSGDDDQLGPVECLPLMPGAFFGTAFAGAATSGAAALVRDYFAKGFAPAGQAGGATVSLTGQELKAALIASADLMTGNPAWRPLSGSRQLEFYNPRHPFTFTPEQGYGRVQLDKLLPLSDKPGTPSFIRTETVTLNLGGSASRALTVIHPEEELRVVISWYDKEATTTGPGSQGTLVRDVDLTVRDCGPDGTCGDADDVIYHGNFFSEDSNYDRRLLDLLEYGCSNDPRLPCQPDLFDPFDACGDPAATCDLVGHVTEDCNSNGILDSGEFSLPVTGTACETGARDGNNNNEAVFLSPEQLAEGRPFRVELGWVFSSEASPPATIDAGLVITGGFTDGTAPNRVRANRYRFSCRDALEIDLLDGAGDATLSTVSTGVWALSRDGTGAVVDSETGLPFLEITAGRRYSKLLPVVDTALVPVLENDGFLSVEDGGRVEVRYTDGVTPAPDAVAGATVRCSPSFGGLSIVRRGTDARFSLTGGCDPRQRLDPRAVIFGQIPGTGSHVTGDLFLDANEDLVYSVAFVSQELDGELYDVKATLKACAVGTIQPDGSCTEAVGIEIFDPVQNVGTLAPGHEQTASFNIHVKATALFPTQIEIVFGLSAIKNGLTADSHTVFHHILDADTWSSPDEDPAISGTFYYSTDFPTGGREIRVLAGELFDPLNPDLAAETFVFQDATSSAGGGGNASLLGFNPATGLFDTPIANNWPWTFDTDDEAWGGRRRFDSDPGDNLELASRNTWQWSNTGECGFQSNDRATQIDGEGGTGGIWHSGHAASMPGTPPGRIGFDLGCEDYDLPGSPDPRRETVVDAVSSPHFFRVHQNVDGDGFAYQLEFLRLAANLQLDVADGNAVFGLELDPDTTTSQPVDPLDLGWLASDQGRGGFLSKMAQIPYTVFNPNDPHRPTSALMALGFLDDTPGSGSQNIREIQGPGSTGSFFDPNDPDKAPARSFGEVSGVLSGRGLGLPERRGAGGLPVRNYDRSFRLDATTFEDLFGPNETRDPDQIIPISAGNPETLINRRDSFQVHFVALLREALDPAFPAQGSYGYGFDDVVVEWRERHPVPDRTPCSDPSTWAADRDGNPMGGPSATPSLASGCAAISWDRNEIADPETVLELTVIDTDAQFGPDGLAGTGDEQAVDEVYDGLAELYVPVSSESDPVGETIQLTQIGLGSPVYRGTVKVSATRGLTSRTDGVIFVQQNGPGTNPVALTAAYHDEDINVAGHGMPGVPCPDNPLTATAWTRLETIDVMLVSARVADEGANADGDNLADDFETVRLDLTVINVARDMAGEPVDLRDVQIILNTADSQVGCLLDPHSDYGDLPFGVAKDSEPSDPYLFVVGDAHRVSATEILQADFTLAIEGGYTDSQGREHRFSGFATPQRFSINLDLDLDPGTPADPLISDSACVGGPDSGRACAAPADCPDGVCAPLPAHLKSGGGHVLAGQIGYFEGFEGAAHMAGRNLTTGPWPFPIAGTSFSHSPAVHASGGYLDGDGHGLTPGSAPGNAPDHPEGTSAVDGLRCPYNDPRGPRKHPRYETSCRPWDGSDWHVTGRKAATGERSLRFGINGDDDLAFDATWDTYHSNALAAAFSGPLEVGVAGGSTLSFEQILQAADDRTFHFPPGQAADRGYVEAVEIDPITGEPLGGWIKLNAFQNNYSGQATQPWFLNCIFDGYDDFYDAVEALGGTPGFNPLATSPVGVEYNRDDVSSEDDYFDPNDPLRQFGPSSGCFPEFVFKAMGDYTSTDPTHSGLATTPGRAGERGTGIWVNSLFSLDSFAGRSIRVRFVFTGVDLFPGLTWAELFGNRLGNGTRGWNIDDVAVSGLLDAPVVLIPDARPTPPADDCPEETDPGDPCPEFCQGAVDADAGPDQVTPHPGAMVTLNASDSRMSDGYCVDGFLEYRWRSGGQIVQDYSTNPILRDTPLFATVYTVDVTCNGWEGTCWCIDDGQDSVTVIPASELEVSGLPDELGTVQVAGGVAGITSVLTRWVEPSIGGPLTTSVVGVDVARNGSELRSDPGGAPGAALLDNLCRLGAATPAGGRDVELTEDTIPLAGGEILGYLATAVTAEGVLGSLGRGEQTGTPGAFSRGRLDPDSLPACEP
jgi:hypothetical protein